MKKASKKFLMSLLNTPSPSGFEQPAAKLWRKYLDNHAIVDSDVHGNSYATVNSGCEFTIMLAGHIDEIGLMVTHIDAKGFLSVAQIGGMDPALLIGQRVMIQTKKGEVLGVVGRKAIHLMTSAERTNAVTMDDIWIDIGVKDKKAAAKKITIGDPMVIDVKYQEIGDNIIARGCDNRAGAFIVAEVIKQLANEKLNVTVVGVATVQEEVGLRGATTSTYNVSPDAGIAIDVTFASDHPATDPKKIGEVNLGAGPVLTRGSDINPVMEKDLYKIAKKHKIPYQLTASPRGTGTDANVMQLSNGGIAVSLISIPNRYMHTPVEMLSLKDIDNIVKLIVQYIKSLPKNKDFRP